jgi:hypothetical protein
MYLPPFKACPMAFMLAVVAGSKCVLREADVAKIRPPTWPELCLKNIWPRVCHDALVARHFPSDDVAALPTREYFWRVLATIRPAIYKGLVDHAISQRSGPDVMMRREAEVTIRAEWLARLMSAQLVKGKSHLLLSHT